MEKSKLHEAEAALAAIVESRAADRGGIPRRPLRRTRDAQRKGHGSREDLVKARKRRSCKIQAPVDGTVQQVAVHTVGGVVTPAQALLAVVPVDSRLEIEAMVSNRDIGFVQVGQDAEIKIDTFDFTRYGLLHGKVLNLSKDAVMHDEPGDRARDRSVGADNETSEPTGQDLAYAARVSLDRTQIQVGENWVNLSPGMAVTVEIKTGSRRIISYLLSPLIKDFLQSSARTMRQG